jgi:hypothetical protein
VRHPPPRRPLHSAPGCAAGPASARSRPDLAVRCGRRCSCSPRCWPSRRRYRCWPGGPARSWTTPPPDVTTPRATGSAPPSTAPAGRRGGRPPRPPPSRRRPRRRPQLRPWSPPRRPFPRPCRPSRRRPRPRLPPRRLRPPPRSPHRLRPRPGRRSPRRPRRARPVRPGGRGGRDQRPGGEHRPGPARRRLGDEILAEQPRTPEEHFELLLPDDGAGRRHRQRRPWWTQMFGV